MKRIALLLTLTLLAGLFAGCGGGSPAADTPQAEAPAEPAAQEEGEAPSVENASGGEVELTFWINDGSTQWMDVWNTVRDNYQEVNPNVQIETFGIPWDSAVTKFNTAAATNTLPDMAHLAVNIVSSMMALDELVDLQPYLDTYDGLGDLNEGHVSFFQQMDPKRPGLWVAPMFGSAGQMWYRVDWFEEQGIDYPETWDEFNAAAAALTTDGRYGYSFRGGPGSYSLLFGYLMGYTDSDEFFDDDGSSFLNRPEALEALEKYVGLYTGGYCPPTGISNGYTEMIGEFSAGNAAMAWHHLQSAQLCLETLEPEQLDYGYIFKNANGRRLKADDAQGIVLFQACEESKRDAAWEYIEFLWTPEQQKEIVVRAGGVPTNLLTDVSDDIYVQKALEQSADPDTVVIVFPSYLPDFSSYCTEVIAPDVQALLLEELSPADAAAKWAADFDEMYEEYWS